MLLGFTQNQLFRWNALNWSGSRSIKTYRLPRSAFIALLIALLLLLQKFSYTDLPPFHDVFLSPDYYTIHFCAVYRARWPFSNAINAYQRLSFLRGDAFFSTSPNSLPIKQHAHSGAARRLSRRYELLSPIHLEFLPLKKCEDKPAMLLWFSFMEVFYYQLPTFEARCFTLIFLINDSPPHQYAVCIGALINTILRPFPLTLKYNDYNISLLALSLHWFRAHILLWLSLHLMNFLLAIGISLMTWMKFHAMMRTLSPMLWWPRCPWPLLLLAYEYHGRASCRCFPQAREKR